MILCVNVFDRFLLRPTWDVLEKDSSVADSLIISGTR